MELPQPLFPHRRSTFLWAGNSANWAGPWALPSLTPSAEWPSAHWLEKYRGAWVCLLRPQLMNRCLTKGAGIALHCKWHAFVMLWVPAGRLLWTLSSPPFRFSLATSTHDAFLDVVWPRLPNRMRALYCRLLQKVVEATCSPSPDC